jgi:uncharacterized protein (TIGR03032 family)
MKSQKLDAHQIWEMHSHDWRDPLAASTLVNNASEIDPKLFQYETVGNFWPIIEQLGITLFVTREYEHLIMAFSVIDGKPRISFYPLPHPSGIAFDTIQNRLYIASTRNPNQLFQFRAVGNLLPRLDVRSDLSTSYVNVKPMVPVSSQFFPGCTYLHELKFIGTKLYANAVGHNAVVCIEPNDEYHRVWWPKCIEDNGKPDFEQNYIQLNSIASGSSLETSFFTASTDRKSVRRPGHKNFKVDKQGVVFSGETRQVIAGGLTRPHSARLYQGKVWVDNSGYGEVGYIENHKYHPYIKLPGWTRGLYFKENIAFVGTSRVLPRFRQYAPGLEVDTSVCGIHTIDMSTKKIIGSITWPFGNQIFDFETVHSSYSTGFPTQVGSKRAIAKEKDLYYSFNI